MLAVFSPDDWRFRGLQTRTTCGKGTYPGMLWQCWTYICCSTFGVKSPTCPVLHGFACQTRYSACNMRRFATAVIYVRIGRTLPGLGIRNLTSHCKGYRAGASATLSKILWGASSSAEYVAMYGRHISSVHRMRPAGTYSRTLQRNKKNTAV